MKLFEQWNDLVEKERNKAESDLFWTNYFEEEKNNYQAILKERKFVLEGTVEELAAQFGMDEVKFTGFIDGINTSLQNEVALDELEMNSAIRMEIDLEKLYFNMLNAKADWLYNLEEWEEILPTEKRADIAKEFKKTQIAVSSKVGRNDPCPCGSGKKYKKCCGV